MTRSLLALALLWGVAARGETFREPALPVLVYHQIRKLPSDPPEGMTVVSLDRFKAEMRRLHEEGYRTLDMAEILRFLAGDSFPPKIVAIQFDDGWRSALRAVPVLERYGFKATFWIVGQSPGSGPLYLDWPAIRKLGKTRRFEVYSHTLTHPYEPGNTLVDWVSGLTPGKSEADALRELSESKRVLEKKLGRPVPYLAWPAGIYNDALVELARRAGYEALATTNDGPNRPGGDPLRIHRTLVNGLCGEQAFARILDDGKYETCDTRPG